MAKLPLTSMLQTFQKQWFWNSTSKLQWKVCVSLCFYMFITLPWNCRKEAIIILESISHSWNSFFRWGAHIFCACQQQQALTIHTAMQAASKCNICKVYKSMKLKKEREERSSFLGYSSTHNEKGKINPLQRKGVLAL